MNHKLIYISVFLLSLFNPCLGYSPAEIYSKLSNEEKGYFLRYYLAKGFLDSQPTTTRSLLQYYFPYFLPIPQKTADNFKHLQIEPSTFPQILLKFFTSKYNLTVYEAFSMARSSCNCRPRDQYICLPNGDCLNVGDAGSICCT